MNAYEIRRIDELDAVPIKEADVTWRPVRRPLGISAFGINAWTGDTGRHVIEEHSEAGFGHEEVYVVIRGRARFTVGGDDHEVDAGTIVYLRDPETTRGAVALEDGTTVLAIGAKPGEAFEPSTWEWVFAAAPARARGDWAAALEIVRDGLAAKPKSPGLHYFVAESLAGLGQRDEALALLRRSLELDAELRPDADEGPREWAAESKAFDGLRDDPEFLAITRQPDASGGGA